MLLADEDWNLNIVIPLDKYSYRSYHNSMVVNVKDAKNNLSKYGNAAHYGETIVVTKNGKPWFDIVPHTPPERDVEPIQGISIRNDMASLLAPIDEEDLPGWT